MWDVFAIVFLSACCLAGIVLTALRLPGTWLIVAGAAAFGLSRDWTGVSFVVLGVLFGIALLAEVVELLVSVVTARKAGASGRATWGGLIGGIVGMCVLSIPVPLIGTIIGALLGCFGGAMIAELSVRGKFGQGAKVGLFAAIGFALGTAAKLALALVMVGILLTSAVASPEPAQSDSEMSSTPG